MHTFLGNTEQAGHPGPPRVLKLDNAYDTHSYSFDQIGI